MRHVAKKTNFSATSCVNTLRHFGREIRHFALVRHFALMRQFAVLQAVTGNNWAGTVLQNDPVSGVDS